MTVFARIDHLAGAASAGLPPRPTELLIFGNAKGGTPLMQADQAMAAALKAVDSYCPVTSTIRKRALPAIMRRYASAACSSGTTSIRGRTLPQSSCHGHSLAVAFRGLRETV
jgi:hypothetical protein